MALVPLFLLDVMALIGEADNEVDRDHPELLASKKYERGNTSNKM